MVLTTTQQVTSIMQSNYDIPKEFEQELLDGLNGKIEDFDLVHFLHLHGELLSEEHEGTIDVEMIRAETHEKDWFFL